MIDRKDRGRNVRGRPFAPGNPGRPKGAIDRRTVVGLELFAALHAGDDKAGLAHAFDRWRRLLNDKDPAIRIRAEELVAAYAYGRPPARVTVAEEQKVVVEFEYVKKPFPEPIADPEPESLPPAPAGTATPKEWDL